MISSVLISDVPFYVKSKPICKGQVFEVLICKKVTLLPLFPAAADVPISLDFMLWVQVDVNNAEFVCVVSINCLDGPIVIHYLVRPWESA